MRIALIGHGAMGRLIESLAIGGGHEIGVVVDSKLAARSSGTLAELLSGHDVAIDFSVAPGVPANVEACVRAGVPLVEGTTGWLDREALVRQFVLDHDGALVFGANFSIGVNVFYRIVANAARLSARVDGYDAFIEEAHHSRKKDAPSGTALRLSAIVRNALRRDLSIASTRAGHIPGTHRVGFDSPADQITLTHTARSREGFASGALLAANWIIGKKGVFEFSEVIDETLCD